MKYFCLLAAFIIYNTTYAQTGILSGRIVQEGTPLPYAVVQLAPTSSGAVADTAGRFTIPEIPFGKYTLKISATGYLNKTQTVVINSAEEKQVQISLTRVPGNMDEVVVTGTMKEMSRSDSPVPVEVFTPKFFRKNPTPSLFESIGMINGIQPQMNCNVCNTGDIHINGMDGPYTLILIDGMPIVSSLSTVYGLNGIPNSLVERIEVVKGPASSLYGSDAMGGIINVITKNPLKAPLFSLDIFGTSWKEYNVDASVKFKVGRAQSLLGVNYFNYQQPYDHNGDHFTDVTLQNRVSVFNKWSFARKNDRVATIAARYVYEDRWGGEMNWGKDWRGSDSIYGESIYTKRFELIGNYQLPFREKIMAQISYNWHDQNSYYGATPFMANQQVAFGQLYLDKAIGAKLEHNILLGATMRYTYYDDNTVGTAKMDKSNAPMKTPLPGVFAQDEWSINKKNKLLVGYRYDYDRNHGSVHSPRVAWKLSPNTNHTIRASFGTGYRVVNLFTEDHAALTGSREVVIAEQLNPERSYNGNLNYVVKAPFDKGFIGLDITGFYSYFTNKIIGDFTIDPDKIIYQNLKGHAISQGVSVNAEVNFTFPLKLTLGGSYMDVYQVAANKAGMTERQQQMFAPKWSGNFLISYTFPGHFILDLTGKVYGPMRLPILPNDYRPEYSPWHCLANVQLTKKLKNKVEIYGGVKNLLNFVPKDPLMRPFDPFDKHVNDPVNNPNGYTFETSYNYAPLQGIRYFLGFRYEIGR